MSHFKENRLNKMFLLLVIFFFLCSQTPFLQAQTVDSSSPVPGVIPTTPVATTEQNPGNVTEQETPSSGDDSFFKQGPLQKTLEQPAINNEKTLNGEPREIERYDFARAIASLQKDVASAVVVKNLSATDIKELVDLDIEVGIAVLHGEIVLFTSGNQGEISVQKPVLGLLQNATFISHTHPSVIQHPQPSSEDIAQAVKAPGAEYVLSERGAYAYNNDGLLNGGIPMDYKAYLDQLNAAVLAGRTAQDQVAARADLNEFIYQMDLSNDKTKQDKTIFRLADVIVAPNSSPVTLTTLPSQSTLFSGAGGGASAATLKPLSSTSFRLDCAIDTSGYAFGGITFFSTVNASSFTFDIGSTTGFVSGDQLKVEFKDSASNTSAFYINLDGSIHNYTFTLANGDQIGPFDSTKVASVAFVAEASHVTAPTGTIQISTTNLYYTAPVSAQTTTITPIVIPSTSTLYKLPSDSTHINFTQTDPRDFAFTYSTLPAGDSNAVTASLLFSTTAVGSNPVLKINGPTGKQIKVSFIDSNDYLTASFFVNLTGSLGTYLFDLTGSNIQAGFNPNNLKEITFTADQVHSGANGTVEVQVYRDYQGEITPDPTKTVDDITNLTPTVLQVLPSVSLVEGGATGDGNSVRTQSHQIMVTDYKITSGQWAGGRIDFTNGGGDTANFEGLLNLTLGLASTSPSIKLEITGRNVADTADVTASFVLKDLSSTVENLYSIPIDILTTGTTLNLQKIKYMRFIVDESLSQGNNQGFIYSEIKGLAYNETITPTANWDNTVSNNILTQWGGTVNDVRTADVNGDGLDDIIARDNSGTWWAAISKLDNSGAITTSENIELTQWGGSVSDVRVGDVNGDGLDDIIARDGSGNLWAAISHASGGANTASDNIILTQWAGSINDFQMADINGDGLDDIIARDNSGTWWAAISKATNYVNTASDTVQLTQWGGTVNDVRTADVNGDGLDDIIARDNSGTWWAAISKLDNSGAITTSENIELTQWGGSVSDVRVGDVNGDGLDDIIARDGSGNLWAAISHASGGANTASDNIILTQWAGSINDFQMADINGDGLDDIIARDNSGTWWAAISKATNYVNTASDTVQLTQWGGTVNDVRTADVNGDGLADIIARDNSGIWWAALPHSNTAPSVLPVVSVEFSGSYPVVQALNSAPSAGIVVPSEKEVTLTYDVSTDGSYAGININYAGHPQDLLPISGGAVFGLTGVSGTVKVEIVDVNGKMDSAYLMDVAGGAIHYYKLTQDLFSNYPSFDYSQIKEIHFIVDKNLVSSTGVLVLKTDGLWNYHNQSIVDDSSVTLLPTNNAAEKPKVQLAFGGLGTIYVPSGKVATMDYNLTEANPASGFTLNYNWTWDGKYGDFSSVDHLTVGLQNSAGSARIKVEFVSDSAPNAKQVIYLEDVSDTLQYYEIPLSILNPTLRAHIQYINFYVERGYVTSDTGSLELHVDGINPAL